MFENIDPNQLKLLHIIGFLNWAEIPAMDDLVHILFNTFDVYQTSQIMSKIIDTPRWKELSKEIDEAK